MSGRKGMVVFVKLRKFNFAASSANGNMVVNIMLSVEAFCSFNRIKHLIRHFLSICYIQGVML
jgi:hypothetical protein